MASLTAFVLPALAAPALLLVVARRVLLVVTVRGASMTPALTPGDRILVLRRPARRLKDRRIVVLRADRIPASGRDDLVVKRVAAREGGPIPPSAGGGLVPDGHLVVLGDNPAVSTDSRVWGPVPAESVVGVMVGRLARAGAARPNVPGAGVSHTDVSHTDVSHTDVSHGEGTRAAASRPEATRAEAGEAGRTDVSRA